MTKQDLIMQLHEKTGVQKSKVEAILEELTGTITEELKTNGKFYLSGLGSFTVHKRTNLRNPKTNEVIEGKTTKYISFKQGSAVKSELNK